MKKQLWFAIMVAAFAISITNQAWTSNVDLSRATKPTVVFMPDGTGLTATIGGMTTANCAQYLVGTPSLPYTQIGIAGPNHWDNACTDRTSFTGFPATVNTTYEPWTPGHFWGTPLMFGQASSFNYFNLAKMDGYFGANGNIIKSDGASGLIIDFNSSDYVAPVAPTLSLTASSIVVEQGTSFSVGINAVANDALPVYIDQYDPQGRVINAGTTATIAGLATTSGTYQVVASNFFAATTATLFVEVKINGQEKILPVIVSQPADVITTEGLTTRFTLEAIDPRGTSWTQALHYQWFAMGDNGIRFPLDRQGDPWNDTSSVTLTTNRYMSGWKINCYVRNADGVTSSREALLTVTAISTAPPTILVAPISQEVSKGDTVIFTAESTGSAPLIESWIFENQVIGAGNQLTLTNVRVNQGGYYFYRVQNDFGEVYSMASLYVAPLPTDTSPTIILAPISQTVYEGDTVTFTAESTGTAPLIEKWGRGVSVIGTGPSLTLYNVDSTQTGNYFYEVHNDLGWVYSTFSLIVMEKPTTTVVFQKPDLRRARQLTIVFCNPTTEGKLLVCIGGPAGSLEASLTLPLADGETITTIALTGPNGWTSACPDVIPYSGVLPVEGWTTFMPTEPGHYRGTPSVLTSAGRHIFVDLLKVDAWFGAKHGIIVQDGSGSSAQAVLAFSK